MLCSPTIQIQNLMKSTMLTPNSNSLLSQTAKFCHHIAILLCLWT